MSRQVRSRAAAARTKGPAVDPVEKIEVSTEHIGLRIAAFVILLLVGLTALAYAFMRFITPGTGWEEIQANSAAVTNCSSDFTLQYNLGAERSATIERREIVTAYTEACVIAYRQFNTDEHFEDTINLYDVNHAPNKVITVNEPLYSALEMAVAADTPDRTLYMGPAYHVYQNVFFASDDSELVDFDPLSGGETTAWYQEMAAFADDPESVSLDILGNGQVRLNVSAEYLRYAEENAIETFLDFSWMKNAFIIDYLAQTLADKGYTYGSISSYDGFVRNLDNRGEAQYGYSLYCGLDGSAYPAAQMLYTGTLSLVNLRTYPLGERDFLRFYVLNNGDVRVPYLCAETGLPAETLKELTVYSGEPNASCAELLLSALPVFTGDTADLTALTNAVWFDGTTLLYTDEALQLEDFYSNGTIDFTSSHID